MNQTNTIHHDAAIVRDATLAEMLALFCKLSEEEKKKILEYMEG